MHIYRYPHAFELECGKELPELDIAYCTFGSLSPERDNVIWICHALTANADAQEWWPGLVGPGKLYDPERYYIVCANMLGSCYGSTGPTSIDLGKGTAYGTDFPLITIRDMVRAHQLLADHLGIGRIHLITGGSMGGQQALEWAVMEPDRCAHICLLATNARHSAWGIAFNEAQRMAIEADPSWRDDDPNAGKAGLEAARAIAMLSYRNYYTYAHSQTEPGDEQLDHFRASSYQRYQGLKLFRRFNVLAYWYLSKAMDSHNLARGRGGLQQALAGITARTLVIGIQSDVLFPIEEQILIARSIPHARLEIIDSNYGHDGFLIEHESIGRLVADFLQTASPAAHPDGHMNGLENVDATPIQFNMQALPGMEGY